MKKRIFALIMAMCLALSLLPASVFAENESGSDVVYGKYGTGTTWTQDKKGTGTSEYKTGDGNTITLSKKATPLGDNTYRIDLEVKTTQTTTTTPPGAAATVLVIDTSGSMDYCSDCGQENSHADGCKYYNRNWRDNSIKNGQTRLAAAKEAAISFLDAYKGDAASVGRYVSLVSFAGSASVKCDWQDVSTTAGYNAVVRAIRNLSANGGTNLDAGLKNAANQFTKPAVSGISKDSKNVIALTDGIPTYYGNNTSQHGSYGCPDTNAATAASAAKLKESASLYTVCFGAANDRCWTAGSPHGWEWTPWGAQEVKHDTEGPLVGAFLRDSIATSATADTTYAYNAANSAELFKAFKAITTSITTGISSGTVTDPMGPNISVTEKPDAFRTEDGKTYTWELANGVKSTDGSKTTYTYQLSYTVKLDTTGEGFDENAYYPTNGQTTFTSGDESFEFPVPGVKGTIPSYRVTYVYDDTAPDNAPALPAAADHKQNTEVTVAAAPALDGYVFSGWTTTDASVSGGKFKMPGNDVTLTGSWTIRSDLSYTVNYYWNGTTDKVAPSKTVGGQTFGARITDELPISVDGYTALKNQTCDLTIGTGTNVINFYYYKNVTLTANSDTATYDGKEHSVSGFTGAPDGADFSAVTVGAKGTDVGTYDAKFADGTVGTVDATAKYIVTAANDGKLTITPVGGIVVTITGNTDSRPYSGAEQFATGYTFTTKNPLYTEKDFTFTGDATAKGTDAGSYAMGLTPAQFENTNPNFENVTFIVTDGKLTITPRAVKLTSEKAEKVYDGMPLTSPDVTVAGDGFVAGEVSDIRATGTVTNVSDGEQPNTIVYTMSAGFKPGNYSIEKDEGTLKITPVTDKVTVTITGNNGSVGYDGDEHSVTGYTTAIDNQLYTVSDFTFTGEDIAKGTDADSYQMGLNKSQFANSSANFTNVEFIVNDGALTVTPRPVTITARSENFTYDGKVHTQPKADIDGLVGNDAIAVTVVGEIQYPHQKVDNVVQSYEFTTGKATNYDVTVKDGKLTMSWPTAQRMTVTANSESKTYDGQSLTNGGYTVEFDGQTYKLKAGESLTLPNGDILTATVAGSVTDVETLATANEVENVSIMNGTTDVHYAYNVTVKNGELKINPRAVTLTSDGGEKIYDGQPLTNSTVTVSGDGFAEGEGAAYNVTGSQTKVGSSENTFTYTLNENTKVSNYEITTELGKLTVTPVTDEVVVTIIGKTDSVTYNGAAQSVTGYKIKSISNPIYTEKDLAFTGEAVAKGTDANTYKMGLSETQFKNISDNFTNVKFDVTDGSLEIAPMDLTITAGSDSKAYDGTPLTSDKFDNTKPADGDTVASVTLTGSQTNVGSSDNVASDAKLMRGDKDVTENYNITYEKGTLAVTPLTDKVTVTITGNTGTVTYKGAEQSVTGYTTAIDNQLYTVSDFTFTGEAIAKGTDADSYQMGLNKSQFANNSANFANVEFVVNDGSLQINPRSVKLTSATDEKVYDGQPLTNGVVTVSGDGFVKGEGAAYNVTGSQTNAGSSDNTFTYTLNPGTKAKNYTVETKPGKLTVTPVTAEVTVTITGNKSTVTYNGAEQSVTGYKVESISNQLYTAADFAFSGTASVTGTDAGSYPMGLKAEQFQNTSKNFTNVKFVVNDGELTINPMPLTITAGSDSKAYNGTPLTNDTFTRTSLAAGDTLASVTVTGSQTNVGSSDNVASDAKLVRGDRDVTANYAIEYVNGKLTVTKNESAKLTADAYRGVYDGAAHDAVVKTTITGAVEGDSWTYAYSLDGENYTAELPQVKNVGAYPVWVKATNDNYVDLVTVVTAEVTPATVLVTADSHEWIIAVKDTCVGDPEPALTYQAESPVAGETPAFSGELSREPGAERGKTYQILQGDLALADGENFLASNYVLQFVPGELTVKARDITITKTVDVTKAFVGDKLTYTITVTNTGDVDLQDVAVVDEMLGIEQVIGELKTGESWTQQFTYTAQESDAGKTLVNTAVTGTKDEKAFDQVDSDGTEITQKPVPTGDQSMVGLWTATLLISAAGAAIILARKSKRSK